MKVVHYQGLSCLQKGAQFHRASGEVHKVGIVQIVLRNSEPRAIELMERTRHIFKSIVIAPEKTLVNLTMLTPPEQGLRW
jgi:hypothetical protein